MDALEPFRQPTAAQAPAPLDYLQAPNDSTYDIQLEARLQTATMDAPHTITRTNFRHLYWSIAQQLAHHTVGGCNLQPAICWPAARLADLPKTPAAVCWS
jgi:fumarylacetoacetase